MSNLLPTANQAPPVPLAPTPREPGVGNLMIGYGLLGVQPLMIVLLTKGGFSAPETVALRFAFGCLLVLAICVVRRRGLSTQQPWMQLLRGVLGAIAVLLFFTSVELAGAARGTLLNYTYPLWANLIAWFFGYKAPLKFWFGLAGALVGIWFVVIPSGGLHSGTLGWGEVSGLVSAIFGGASIVTVKKLRETDESLTILTSFSVIGLLASLPLATHAPLHLLADPSMAFAGFAVGALSFFGHFFFTRGYRGASLRVATLLSLCVPLLAAIGGSVVFGEELGWRFIGGASLILFSLAWVMRMERPLRT